MNSVFLWFCRFYRFVFFFVDFYETSSSQVSPLQSTGYLPLGPNWPYEVQRRAAVADEADYSDNEHNDTVQEKNVDQDRRHLLWNVILTHVDEDLPESTAAILELSDPPIFMLLTFNTELLNDLIFLDCLTEDNSAFTYMAHTLQQLAVNWESRLLLPKWSCLITSTM